MNTLAKLIETGKGDAIALSAPDREGLNYDGLRSQVGDTVERLNSLGVGRNDTVAIVLPNGPEMASAFISIGAGATTAPLNPSYRKEEFDFYLEDLKPMGFRRSQGFFQRFQGFFGFHNDSGTLLLLLL